MLQSKLVVQCLSQVTDLVKLAGVEWYDGKNGYVKPNCPCLVVAYDNGRAQLMSHEIDDSKSLIIYELYPIVIVVPCLCLCRSDLA